MKYFLKKIVPFFIIDLYKLIKRLRKNRALINEEKRGNTITKSIIVEKLKFFGVNKNEVVMLHSSLSKIGFVEGGAKTVIDSFIEVLGNEGTLAMPSFPAVGYNFDYLSTRPIFNLNQTPSKTGIITELFRKMPKVVRSLHPTDSVTAIGKHAMYLTNSHYNQLTPYNSQSPFYKLCELNAKIILLGVDFNSLTNLHTLEDAVDNFIFPVYHQNIVECDVEDGNDIRTKVKTKVHDPKWSKQRKCNELIPYFRNAGFLREEIIGNATVYIIEAKSMHDWMLLKYKENKVTMYTPHGQK